MSDIKQTQVQEFEVPDPSRIRKGINMIKDKFSSSSSNSDIKVLDIGLAKNGFGDTIQNNYGCQVYGIDIHPRNFDNIETIVHDVNKGLPYKDKFYDIITAGELMEHMYNDEEFLRECHRCLKDEGSIVLTVPNIHFLVNRIIMLFGQMPIFTYCSFHYNIYNKDELIKKLERNGFKVSNVKGSHILCSSRRNPIGKVFEYLAELLPSFSAHLIVRAEKV